MVMFFRRWVEHDSLLFSIRYLCYRQQVSLKAVKCVLVRKFNFFQTLPMSLSQPKPPCFFKHCKINFCRAKIASTFKVQFLTAPVIKNGTNCRARLFTKLWSDELFLLCIFRSILYHSESHKFCFFRVFLTLKIIFSVRDLLCRCRQGHKYAILISAQRRSSPSSPIRQTDRHNVEEYKIIIIKKIKTCCVFRTSRITYYVHIRKSPPNITQPACSEQLLEKLRLSYLKY